LLIKIRGYAAMGVIKFIQSFHNGFFDQLFPLITMLGEDYFFMAMVALIYWCINKGFGYRLGFAYLSNGVINSAIKETFQVPRPFQRDTTLRVLRPETAGGYSFPSGHTQCSASFWTSMMIAIKSKWIYIAGTILIILVGISRMYLGVHTPQDVLVGAVIGVAWVFVSNKMFDYAEKTGRKTIFLVFIIPAIIGMFIFRTIDYYKVAGTVISFYIGYLIETNYINFQVKTVLWKQIVKFVLGMAILLAIKVLLKPILPEGMIGDFIRYFAMGAWVTVAAPLFFKHVLCKKDSIQIFIQSQQ
jgi:membrane-associated phospholipid phosphatase